MKDFFMQHKLICFGVILGLIGLVVDTTNKDYSTSQQEQTQLQEETTEEVAEVEKTPQTLDEKATDIVLSSMSKYERESKRTVIKNLDYNEDTKTLSIGLDTSVGLTENGTKLDIYLLTRNILEKSMPLVNEDDIQNIDITVNLPLVDQYGNENIEKVFWVSYSRSTLDKINWDNIYTKNMAMMADDNFVHPTLLKAKID